MLSKCWSYHPVRLLLTVFKVSEKLFLQRLIPDHQFGCKLRHGIYITEQVHLWEIKSSISEQQNLFYMDFRTATLGNSLSFKHRNHTEVSIKGSKIHYKGYDWFKIGQNENVYRDLVVCTVRRNTSMCWTIQEAARTYPNPLEGKPPTSLKALKERRLKCRVPTFWVKCPLFCL